MEVSEIPSGGTVSFISTFLVSTTSSTATLAAVKETRGHGQLRTRLAGQTEYQHAAPSKHISLYGGEGHYDVGCCGGLRQKKENKMSKKHSTVKHAKKKKKSRMKMMKKWSAVRVENELRAAGMERQTDRLTHTQTALVEFGYLQQWSPLLSASPQSSSDTPLRSDNTQSQPRDDKMLNTHTHTMVWLPQVLMPFHHFYVAQLIWPLTFDCERPRVRRKWLHRVWSGNKTLGVSDYQTTTMKEVRKRLMKGLKQSDDENKKLSSLLV